MIRSFSKHKATISITLTLALFFVIITVTASQNKLFVGQACDVIVPSTYQSTKANESVEQILDNVGNKVVAYAEGSDDEDTEQKLEDEINDRLDELDLTEFERFIAEIDKNNYMSSNLKEYIKGMLKGEFSFSLTEILNIVVQNVFLRFTDFLPMFIMIIIISILCGITNNLSSGFLNKSTNKLVYLTCVSSIIIILVVQMSQLVLMVTEFIGNVNALVQIVFPILLTLITALGSVVTVAVYQPLMPLIATTIVGIISSIIIPSFIAIMIFNIVGHLSDSIKLNKLTKALKSISEWLLGIIYALFIMYISVQGIVGMSIDAVSVRATKFAISSYVPILGGYLAEGFDLVTASCILLKNVIGVSGIMTLFLMIIIPISQLIVFILGLKLTAAIVEPLGDKKISDMLTGVSEGTTLLITAILGVAFMLFIMLMLIIYSFNLGVM